MEGKRNYKALTISLAIHGLLLLVFYFTTLHTAKQPETEYGAIAVNFSNITTTVPKAVTPSPLKKVEAVKPVKKMLTQDNDNISVNDNKEEEEKEEEKPKEVKDQYADLTNNLFDNIDVNDNTSEQTKNDVVPDILPIDNIKQIGGTSASDEQNLNAFLQSAGKGQYGGSGYFLNGRGLGKLVKPKYASDKEGYVVVEIHVDENGKTIYARSGVKGTTLTDPKILENTQKAALNTTWSTKLGVKRQVGYIIYNFKIK